MSENPSRWVQKSRRFASLGATVLALFALAGCHKCMVTPRALDVDAGNNGVFEPGETVEVAPSWHYQSYSGGPCAFNNPCPGAAGESLHAVDFTGPGGATYTIVNDTATYTIPINTTQNCYSAADCYVLSVSAPATRPAAHWDAFFSEQALSAGLDIGWLYPMGSANPDQPLTCSIQTPAPKSWTLHVGKSFTDVPTTHPFYRFSETLFHNSITAGCNNSAYCPGNSIRRYQMAVFLLKGLHGAGYVPPSCSGVFSDVPCPGPFTDWVEDVATEGIIAACGPGTFCPNVTVTRSDMAMFLLKASIGTDYGPPAAMGLFGDVPLTDPRAPWIEDLYNRQITAGCSASPLLYCPDNANNRGQMAVFVDKTFGLRLYGP